HDLPDLAFALRILHQYLVERLHVGPGRMDEVHALQGDLSLGALGVGFHEMLRRETAEIFLGLLFIAQSRHYARFSIAHVGSLLIDRGTHASVALIARPRKVNRTSCSPCEAAKGFV